MAAGLGHTRLDERELHTWQTFFRMQEVLRGRIEQQLQACSGLSMADYSVLTILSSSPNGRLRAYCLSALLGWEKSRLHHQLTRMARRGLVDRPGQAAPGHSRHVRDLVIDRLNPGQIDQLAEISAAILGPSRMVILAN